MWQQYFGIFSERSDWVARLITTSLTFTAHTGFVHLASAVSTFGVTAGVVEPDEAQSGHLREGVAEPRRVPFGSSDDTLVSGV